MAANNSLILLGGALLAGLIVYGILDSAKGADRRKMIRDAFDDDTGLTEKERILKHYPHVEFVPDEPKLQKLPPVERPFYRNSSHDLPDYHWPIDIANGYAW